MTEYALTTTVIDHLLIDGKWHEIEVRIMVPQGTRQWFVDGELAVVQDRPPFDDVYDVGKIREWVEQS